MTETTEAQEWTLPLERIYTHQRGRMEIHKDSDAVPATVESWHIGQDAPTCMVFIGGGAEDITPRDAALHAAHVLAVVGAADYVVCTIDSYVTNVARNPETQKSWEPGEMTQLRESGGASAENVLDALSIMIARRDGLVLQHNMPYRVNDGTLQRLEESTGDEWTDSAVLGGIVTDALREAMTEPTSMSLMRAKGIKPPEGPARLGQLYAALAAVRVLGEAAAANGNHKLFECVVGASNEQEQAILARFAQANGGEMRSG